MQTLNIIQKYYTKELNIIQLKMNFDVGVFIPQDNSVRLLRNIVHNKIQNESVGYLEYKTA